MTAAQHNAENRKSSLALLDRNTVWHTMLNNRDDTMNIFGICSWHNETQSATGKKRSGGQKSITQCAMLYFTLVWLLNVLRRKISIYNAATKPTSNQPRMQTVQLSEFLEALHIMCHNRSKVMLKLFLLTLYIKYGLSASSVRSGMRAAHCLVEACWV